MRNVSGASYLLAACLILGLLISVYLTYVHFQPEALYCPKISQAINCEQVTTSGYSTLLGIPLAILGLVWFLVSAGFYVLKKYNMILRNIWMIFGLGGVTYSLSAQALLAKLCIYCVSLDALMLVSVALFVLIKK